MTTGGILHVMSKNTYDGGFSVKFARNTVITNYTGRKMGEVGDIKTQVKNGKDGTTRQVYSNGLSGELYTMDLGTKRFKIFDTLRKLDGNESDVSDKDLAMAKSLKGKGLGVTDVRMDANAGITTIVCDDGAVLKFDVETDAEKEVREKKEAAKQADQKKTQPESTEKSALEKFGDGIAEFFRDLFN